MTAPDYSLIDGHLRELSDRKASDLLLTAGSPPLLRIDGALVALDEKALTPADTAEIVEAMLDADMHERFRTEMEVDFSFGRPGLARFRVNAFHQRGAAAIALRLIPFGIPTFADLDLPPIFDRIVRLPQGLVLVTGPTGSGKSTTLASMIDRINEERACHIVTIEDPIEYLHNHKQSAVNQREIGVDAVSFPRAVRAVLREDPDVVLVGEMRDTETIASGAHRRRDRAPGVGVVAHQRRGAVGRSRRRRVPRRPAAADPGAARRVAPGDRVAAARPEDRRR